MQSSDAFVKLTTIRFHVYIPASNRNHVHHTDNTTTYAFSTPRADRLFLDFSDWLNTAKFFIIS